MLYCINLIRGGLFGALLSFLIWSLPGAIGMYGLSIGVANIGDKLPGPVYALLSGLNAATVGVIALAAVELSQKAITDNLTRVVVFLSASVGMLYTALWYFPVLMVISGLATLTFDFRWVHRPVLTALHPAPSLLYRLFANMYLAGTIIFGGGPVVIPLLREYVVAEGWVSPRDFLIGLAVIQAFPGPNFNFAVFLGSLTALGGGHKREKFGG
ncbi:hypothetical protein N0V88_002123 [Collariella sp. IMI 366227]|nr:hypothetical protein N0V88_002123 [Collariella sp. IMI 366227]